MTTNTLKFLRDALEGFLTMRPPADHPRDWNAKYHDAITELRTLIASLEYQTTRPVESDYKSHVAYARALEAYCDGMVQPVGEPVACIVGMKGSAFDSPETKRAYTYAEQPGNVVASKLGSACIAASKQPGGDSIDSGLSLLKELQAKGFGVFDIGAEYLVASPVQPVEQPALTDEQIDKAWRSVDYTQPYEDFRIAIARAIEAAHGIGVKEQTT